MSAGKIIIFLVLFVVIMCNIVVIASHGKIVKIFAEKDFSDLTQLNTYSRDIGRAARVSFVGVALATCLVLFLCNKPE